MAVGGLVGSRNGYAPSFLGTCFAVRRPDVFLTAKHVVSGVDVPSLRVAIGGSTETAVVNVGRVVEHPRADIAVVFTTGSRRYVAREDEANGLNGQTPRRIDRETAWFNDDVEISEVLSGVWYEAYGLVTDMPSHLDRGGVGEGRCFRGYFHRAMSYRDGWGAYKAVELSSGIPGGASGSPIYDPNDHRRVIALATATVESSIPGNWASERDPGQVVATTEETMRWRVGIGLILSFVRPWVDSTIESWLRDQASAATST